MKPLSHPKLLSYVAVDAATGILWVAGKRNDPPVCLEHANIADYVQRRQKKEVVRTVALPHHSELIARLYDHCKVEVCTPRLLRHGISAGESLMRMREWLLAPSLGGWHALDEFEVPAYAHGIGTHPMEKHLIWKDVQFITDINLAAVADLIAEIRDPRWFVNFEAPERLGLILTWLGVRPRNLLQVMSGENSRPSHRRLRMVLDCWWQGHPARQKLSFPWRGKTEGASLLSAIGKSCRRFVCFVYRIWQQRIADRRFPQVQLFEPSLLFDKNELVEWSEFCQRNNREH